MSVQAINCNELADYEWLTGEEASTLAKDIADFSEPLHVLVDRLRRRLSAGRAHLLLELIELRRSAADKFSHADRMFFTRVGLEQATDEWVARYKATHFARRSESCPTPTSSAPVMADLCCGIGGDLLALAEHGPTIGVDQNPIVTHLAAVNAQAVLPKELSARVTTSASDVAHYDVTGVAAWHIDPDRRSTGNRTTSLDWSSPSREVIERLLTRQPNAAVKLAPATVVPTEWTERCELEWISRDRQCRQLVAWHGALADGPGQRRATILAARGFAQRTLIGRPNGPVSIAGDVQQYIFDVDPAVSAAHLTGVIAGAHNLSALAAGPSYLTGKHIINDPAFACFEVEEVLPLQPKKIAAYLHERSIGQLEIKKRGVEIDPEKLRRDLKPRGEASATLLIARHAGRHIAVVATRVRQPS